MYKPLPTSTVNDPPFAIDLEFTLSTLKSSSSWNSSTSLDSAGYRSGGPKEARLKRVAPISPHKPENLFPLKIENIPRNISTATLKSKLNSFGEIADVYIPKKLETMQPATDFAVIRFMKEESALRALESYQNNDVNLEQNPFKLSPLKKQESTFSQGTGCLGISNEAYDDGTRDRKKEVAKQDVPLSSCMAISGYPWGIKREIKFLPPHVAKETFEMYSLKITNLTDNVTPEEIKKVFTRYGEVGDVTCPKPLLVIERTNKPNCGFAFVRYKNRLHLENALEAVKSLSITIDNQTIFGESLVPPFWPTEKTRRYY